MKNLHLLSLLFCAVAFSVPSFAQDTSNDSASRKPSTQVTKKAESNQKKHNEAKKAAEEVTRKVKSNFTVANKLLMEHDYFSISSGAVGGAYFVLGELIAGVVSRPTYSLDCGKGGSCGVDHLVGLNTTSSGSVANLKSLNLNLADSGFAQSNILYWAYTGTSAYKEKGKMSNLRAIASLYTEYMHIIVRRDANIKHVSDLVGKRVSLGLKNSGTLYDALNLLQAANITTDQLTPLYLSNTEAIDDLKAGKVDAVFAVVGTPAPFFSELTADEDKDVSQYDILSISPEVLKGVLDQAMYYVPGTIPADMYQGIGHEVKTYAVRAVWVTHKETDKKLAYELTRALWSKDSRLTLDTNATGRKIQVERSLEGIGIPLHAGAKQYYNKIGKRF